MNGEQASVLERGAAAVALEIQFADLLGDALLKRYSGGVRPVHRVVLARMLRDGGATALIAALDAVREVAGESREVILDTFMWALAREGATPLATGVADFPVRADEDHVGEVGADACLLERMAEDAAGLAEDAAGIDATVEQQARSDAAKLTALARRHAIHFIGRDVAPRAPFVEHSGDRG